MSETVAHCPKCEMMGVVIGHRGKTVSLECPNDSSKWLTKSKICPDCEKPNGYAVDGVCSSCYGKYYKSF
jgi:hypothetical protein